MPTLLLRLAGPMQSWGTQSRFDVRDTEREPSKSGVIGLLCAALGRPRTAPVDDLAGLRMGVRVDREGRVERDYQTAGGARAGAYGVVKAAGGRGEAVISSRYYLADADFLVGLESSDHDLLSEIDTALERPRWGLFLGRRSYVASLPIRTGVVEAPLGQALRAWPWDARTPWERDSALQAARAGDPLQLRLVLDAPYGSTLEIRHDVPVSFEEGRRSFLPRSVRTEFMPLVKGLIRFPEED